MAAVMAGYVERFHVLEICCAKVHYKLDHQILLSANFPQFFVLLLMAFSISTIVVFLPLSGAIRLDEFIDSKTTL
jgi:hypothetical protein